MAPTSNSTAQSIRKRDKTYKRELAGLVTLLWGVVSIKMFWYTQPDLVTAFNGPYSTLTMAMMGIVGAALGLEWFTAQSPWSSGKKE